MLKFGNNRTSQSCTLLLLLRISKYSLKLSAVNHNLGQKTKNMSCKSRRLFLGHGSNLGASYHSLGYSFLLYSYYPFSDIKRYYLCVSSGRHYRDCFPQSGKLFISFEDKLMTDSAQFWPAEFSNFHTWFRKYPV